MNTQPVGYKAKAFEARNLTFFFLIALGAKLILGLLIFFGLPQPPLLIFPLIAILCSPSAAAFVVTGLTEGKPGVRALWRRFWNRNVSFKWLLVALLLLPVLRLVAGVLTQLLYDPSYPLFPEDAISGFIFGVAYGLFFGLQEEFGWRGYVLPRFQVKWNALASSIVLGVITGAWHVTRYIAPGEILFGSSFWEWFPWHMLIQIVGYTWIFNNTKGNLLALVLFHASTSFGVGNLDIWTYCGVMLVAAILIVAIFGPKNLVRQKREKAVEQDKVQAMND
jgi:membrane protease YdiL (CAAX protease family)